jgi:hypothetical protein
MTITNNASVHFRVVPTVLAACCCLLLCPKQIHAGDENYRAKNVAWKIVKDEIVITYDLEGDFTEKYNIAVLLRRERDKEFLVEPRTVSGDIGEEKLVGTKKTIRWKYLRDEPKGFAGNDYYFEIIVEQAGGFPWLWVGGGAAAAGVAVALLLKKDEVIPPPDLAEPPGRPPR